MKEDPEQRSRVMRAVKATDTAPEMVMRKMAHRMGYRFRLHRADLPGKPDLVFPKRHKVIFVHGCFWHGHKCPRGNRAPKSNAAYWQRKLARNTARDAAALKMLRRIGWGVAVFWECELKEPDRVKKRLASFLG